MAVNCDPGTYVPPAHMFMLNDFVRSYPGDWWVLNAEPAIGKYGLHQQVEGGHHFMTVELDVEPLFGLNQSRRNDSNGQRFGDGKVIASVPQSMLFNENALSGLGRALTEGDDRKVSRILNDSDYSKLRTFRGTV